MKSMERNWIIISAWVLLSLGLGVGSLPAAVNTLQWNGKGNRVAAEITSWNLDHLLEKLAAATDWEIYVEPDVQRRVSTKFSDKKPGEALRLLLGDLSYALVPRAPGPSRLYVFQTSPQEATKRVRPPLLDTAIPIADELIVKLKPGQNIDEIAKELGAEVMGKLDGMNAYRLRFKDEAARDAARDILEKDERVESVGYNYRVSNQPAPEGLALSSHPSLNLKLKPSDDTDRVTIGLIDTDINRECSGYPDLILPSLSVAGPSAPPTGTLSHADAMAQAMLRGLVAASEGASDTRVQILPVDIYGGRPSTTTFEVARGIVAAVNAGARIINLSLGSDGNMDGLREVIRDAHAQGVIFLAAAGNEPTDLPTYPAAYPEVVAVTAGTRDGQIASYANYGGFVDAVAPGSIIVNNCQGAQYLVTGTSVATANLAGAVAGIVDKTGKPPAEIEQTVRQSSPPKEAAK